MARKWTLSEQVEFMRADARRAQRREEAARVAQESAWERRHAELMVEQQAAGLAAAEAARAEARAQGERTRLHAWMMASPVGRAWAQVTAPGGADSVLAQRVEARCVAWRRAWAEQCQGDGLAPVTARAAHGEAVADLLRFLAWMLAFVAVVLFALNTVGWLWNHSWATPQTRLASSEPLRGTREFFTPGLAVASYVAAGTAAAGWLGAFGLDWRRRTKTSRLAQQATERNAAMVAERTQRYGFDPLGERLPARAQWAVLPDGTDPEDALETLTAEDTRQRRQHEYVGMDHVERLRVVAVWGGAVRGTPQPGCRGRWWRSCSGCGAEGPQPSNRFVRIRVSRSKSAPAGDDLGGVGCWDSSVCVWSRASSLRYMNDWGGRRADDTSPRVNGRAAGVDLPTLMT